MNMSLKNYCSMVSRIPQLIYIVFFVMQSMILVSCFFGPAFALVNASMTSSRLQLDVL